MEIKRKYPPEEFAERMNRIFYGFAPASDVFGLFEITHISSRDIEDEKRRQGMRNYMATRRGETVL